MAPFFFVFVFCFFGSPVPFLLIKILLFPAPPPPPPQPATLNNTAKLHWIPSLPFSFLIFVREHRGQEYLTLHTFT